MAPTKGDKVLIIKGPNTGKRGVFDSNTGFVSCYVLLDGSAEKQMFRRGSVQVLPPDDQHNTRNHNHGSLDEQSTLRALIDKTRRLRIDVEKIEEDLTLLLENRRENS